MADALRWWRQYQSASPQSKYNSWMLLARKPVCMKNALVTVRRAWVLFIRHITDLVRPDYQIGSRSLGTGPISSSLYLRG
mmetsp:Transcript_28755/g.70700  ORF Transcript_28755/g.70700 Transcript_28755/m.70700 type:complete len:80 (-) Transcript_28755:359-598(-)|eukprot:2813183-Prymnesium_polylepis.1